MLRRFRLVGVLAAVGATVGGAFASAALDNVEGAATVGAPAERLAVPDASTTGVATTVAPPNGGLAAAVIALVNTERAGRGLAPYATQPQVMAAAQVHSSDMASHRALNHTGSDGSNAGDRLVAQGFTWGAWGENIAAGQDTAQSVFNAWMNSTGHRPQMIGNYAYVGVGVASADNGVMYWTLLVAS